MLSLVVIAKNEADRIGPCLESVPFADEILVLDSGSTDDTARICRAAGARVVHTDWPGFVAQKNRALAMASGDWVLSLDADERLSPAAQADVRRVLESQASEAYSFPRLSTWMGRPLRHGRWYPDRKVRLARRDVARWVGFDPHDRLAVEGHIEALSGDILHDPYRVLSEHLETIDRYSRIQADSWARAGRRAYAWDPWVRPPLHFVDSAIRLGGFQDGWRGMAVASLGAWYVHRKWMRLWQG